MNDWTQYNINNQLDFKKLGKVNGWLLSFLKFVNFHSHVLKFRLNIVNKKLMDVNYKYII